MFRTALAATLLGAVEGILPKLHPHHRQGVSHADSPWNSNAYQELECGLPVARAPVKFPKELLAGQNAGEGLKMHSGYVNVTSEDYLFYWFIEAASGSRNAPVIVWSNGGPGCSGMEGASTEIGPLILYMSKMGTPASFPGKLSRNPYSWNEKANLLIVDQPRYVGFSTGAGSYVCSSQEAGLDMVTFLLGWAELFTDIVPRPKYIFASESYGGHYVPAWTRAVLDHNMEESKDQRKIKLAGLLIGNGITDEKVQNDAEFIKFAKVEGLIPEDSDPANEDAARKLMEESLGYVPNYYDYRLRDIPCEGEGCCGIYSYNYTEWSLWFMKSEVKKALNVCGDAGDNCYGPVGTGCFGGCIDFTGCPQGFDHKDMFDYTGALQNALKMGIPITLYYGMQDTACNYVGGYALAETLGGKRFHKKRLQTLSIGGAATAETKTAGGVTWYQVSGAGHMVPSNNGGAAYYALNQLLRKTSKWHALLSKIQRRSESGKHTWLTQKMAKPHRRLRGLDLKEDFDESAYIQQFADLKNVSEANLEL